MDYLISIKLTFFISKMELIIHRIVEVPKNDEVKVPGPGQVLHTSQFIEIAAFNLFLQLKNSMYVM